MSSNKRTQIIHLFFLLCAVSLKVTVSYSHVALIKNLGRKTMPVRPSFGNKLVVGSLRSGSMLQNEIHNTDAISHRISIRRNIQKSVQKYMLFCTLFLTSLLTATRRVIAAAAPLAKNVKVTYARWSSTPFDHHSFTWGIVYRIIRTQALIFFCSLGILHKIVLRIHSVANVMW